VLYFLNDVEEGGETAFPIADNETFDEDVGILYLSVHLYIDIFHFMINCSQIWHKDVKRVCNVGHNCHKSNLRVKPERGKAILWYSHEISSVTGWMGSSDPYSVHGGCDVKKGRKWIANNWITVSENRTDDIEFWIKNLQNTGAVMFVPTPPPRKILDVGIPMWEMMRQSHHFPCTQSVGMIA
jgi:hypoxia-inducible factor prolyl 4-hydroxylase